MYFNYADDKRLTRNSYVCEMGLREVCRNKLRTVSQVAMDVQLCRFSFRSESVWNAVSPSLHRAHTFQWQRHSYQLEILTCMSIFVMQTYSNGFSRSVPRTLPYLHANANSL